MKQKDVITGWFVAFIISCMMLTDAPKSQETREENHES